MTPFIQLRAVRWIAFIIAASLATKMLAADPSATGKHCLWRVTNARAPFYLLGSVHALRPRDYPLAPVIADAIQQSQQFWFEIDLRQDELFTKKVKAAAHYPKGVHIKDKINPKTYAYLMRITQRGTDVWEDLKPWAIALFLLRHPEAGEMSRQYGIESHIFQKARIRGRPVGGIESLDEHIRVFSDMQDIEGEIYLLQTLVHVEEIRQYPEEIAAWKAGDVDRLYAMQLPKIKEAPTVWWRLLDRRNARWIPRIETEIKTGKPTMIVVGAMHFPGPHGLLAMLRARGYKLEQL
ncbi:MAG: uncharacterized protein QOI04_2397 [Verrucomicrobiota bacterium]